MIEPPHQPGDLPPEVQSCLRRAEGFVDLKMPARARVELERIPAALHDHPACRVARLNLLMLEKNWAEAFPIARRLREQFPQHAEHWISDAYVTRRARNIAEAEPILIEAAGLFPRQAVIVYNLACYACQLGHLDKARALLKLLVQHHPEWRAAAVQDDDLAPLHDELEEDA